MKRLAVFYALVLIGIVVAADMGLLRPLFRLVGRVPHGDTLGHFALLGMLSLTLNLAFRTNLLRIGPFTATKLSWGLALLITIEECSQLALTTRSFSLADLAANYLGIFIFGRWAQRF